MQTLPSSHTLKRALLPRSEKMPSRFQSTRVRQSLSFPGDVVPSPTAGERSGASLFGLRMLRRTVMAASEARKHKRAAYRTPCRARCLGFGRGPTAHQGDGTGHDVDNSVRSPDVPEERGGQSSAYLHERHGLPGIVLSSDYLQSESAGWVRRGR
ncbi:hypothetical protein A1Q2_03538 [Trichosporon asahii var. asahii CBS 8904]|uniref:Uncharacterized protein n=1 Tax=Trichosporon asahii var. asahii (strain CBS 8904) TaxID=1220162 RepID=K1VNJ0_TRIAC|nr:hypothetical protein A1Q2_03538 [Trichosporon asahii var. asahii CBS 8904]